MPLNQLQQPLTNREQKRVDFGNSLISEFFPGEITAGILMELRQVILQEGLNLDAGKFSQINFKSVKIFDLSKHFHLPNIALFVYVFTLENGQQIIIDTYGAGALIVGNYEGMPIMYHMNFFQEVPNRTLYSTAIEYAASTGYFNGDVAFNPILITNIEGLTIPDLTKSAINGTQQVFDLWARNKNAAPDSIIAVTGDFDTGLFTDFLDSLATKISGIKFMSASTLNDAVAKVKELKPKES